jgi:hypothetical protein
VQGLGVADLTQEGEVGSCSVCGWRKNEARRMWSTTGLEFLSIVFVFWTPLLEGDEGRRGINAV